MLKREVSLSPLGKRIMIADFDVFGKPVRLNFNKNGDTHNTRVGGVCSIIAYILYLAYIGLLLKKMFCYEEDRF